MIKYCRRCQTEKGKVIPDNITPVNETKEAQESLAAYIKETYAHEVYVSPKGAVSSYCLECLSEMSAERSRMMRCVERYEGNPPDVVPDKCRMLLAKYLFKEARKCLQGLNPHDAFPLLYKRTAYITKRQPGPAEKLDTLKLSFPGLVGVLDENYLGSVFSEDNISPRTDGDVANAEKLLTATNTPGAMLRDLTEWTA